ncbi:MAG: hypothetical protein AB7G21_06690 [Dehalococcoidia bacterium]
MNHITRRRERARLFSILLIAAVFALCAFTLQATAARADEPDSPPPAEETTSGDTGDTTAADTAGADAGDGSGTGGEGTGTGGDATGAGGSNEAGNDTGSTGGDASSTGGTASAEGAGEASSSNTATNELPTDAGPGSTTTTNTVTDDQTGATGGTGSQTGDPGSTSAEADGPTGGTGAGSEGVTPATPEAPSTPSITANAGANVSTGNATAIGNMSQTDIVQIVIAIVNITMPNVNAQDIVGPLVTINQTADVVNAGIANAMTGGNTAVATLLSTVGGGGQVTAQQLAGLATTGQAGVESGSAEAVGNLSWTEVMQIASVITSVNGDASLTQQLTEIQQNVSVTNAGTATADTGGNTAEVSVAVQSGTGGDDDLTDPNPGGPAIPAGAEAEVDPYPGETNRRVLLWGPAPSSEAIVWIYVDGRQCKTAKIEEARGFPGAYDWWAYVYPNECGAGNGSELTFVVGQRMTERVVFNNKKRESPQITFQALMQADLAVQGQRR